MSSITRLFDLLPSDWADDNGFPYVIATKEDASEKRSARLKTIVPIGDPLTREMKVEDLRYMRDQLTKIIRWMK